MKLQNALTLSLALILSPFLRASDLPAPMPEFMNQQQLAKWKADQAAEAKADAAAQDAPTQFYTGKPYDAEAGGYIFKYRTYNPEMARWTTADPSGFPDGVNNNFYAPTPTIEVDAEGLSLEVTNLNPTTSSLKDSSGQYTISSTAATQLDNNFGHKFHGYTFTPGTLSTATTLDINSYAPQDFGLSTTYGQNGINASGGATFTVSVMNAPSAPSGSTYAWIQIITTNDRGTTPGTGAYYDIDRAASPLTPFYPGVGTGPYYFTDDPWRYYSDMKKTSVGNPITFTADLYWVSYDGNAVTVYGGVSWNFTIKE